MPTQARKPTATATARSSTSSITNLARRYGLQHIPALVVINSRGKICTRIDGYNGFLSELEIQLEHGITLAEESYEAYKKELTGKGYREWTSRKGEKLFAKLQRYDEKKGAVYLREPGGRVSRTPLVRFCKADIELLDAHARGEQP